MVCKYKILLFSALACLLWSLSPKHSRSLTNVCNGCYQLCSRSLYYSPLFSPFTSQDYLWVAFEPVALGPQPGVGLHTCLSSPFWDFVSSADLVCVVKFTVSPSVQLPCCVQKVLFCCTHLPLALTLFLPALMQWSPSLGRQGNDICVPLRAKHSTLFFSAPWPVVGLCVSNYSNHLLQKKLL